MYLEWLHDHYIHLHIHLLKHNHASYKKGAIQSGSPIQDGQDEKVVKSRWQPRNDCDEFVLPHPSFTRNQHKIVVINFFLP